MVLEDPKFDSPGNAWSNLGVTLAAIGEYDKAINAYHKALDDPEYENPGYTWNNLGVSLAAKGENDKAIEAYHKALGDSKYDTPGNVWNNLGVRLTAMGEHDDAPEAHSNAALIAPELARRKEPLESMPLDVMAMVGYLDKSSGPSALLKVDQLIYPVKIGNYLGMNYGKITKITETTVKILIILFCWMLTKPKNVSCK